MERKTKRKNEVKQIEEVRANNEPVEFELTTSYNDTEVNYFSMDPNITNCWCEKGL